MPRIHLGLKWHGPLKHSACHAFEHMNLNHCRWNRRRIHALCQQSRSVREPSKSGMGMSVVSSSFETLTRSSAPTCHMGIAASYESRKLTQTQASPACNCCVVLGLSWQLKTCHTQPQVAEKKQGQASGTSRPSWRRRLLRPFLACLAPHRWGLQ